MDNFIGGFVLKTITKHLFIFSLLSTACFAEDPSIKAKFYSAESIEHLPELKYLNETDSGFNKVILKAEGFPKNQDLILEVKRLSSDNPNQFKPLMEFSIQNDGQYLTKTKPSKLINSIIVSSKGFLPGERVTYRIRTTNKSVQKEISGIPSPALFKDHRGIVDIKAELISISPTVYLVTLPSMKDGEAFELKSTSLGEIITAESKYSKAKPIHYSPAPSSTKSQGGESTLEIIRKSGEIYVIRLPWGSALQVYQQGKKIPLYH